MGATASSLLLPTTVSWAAGASALVLAPRSGKALPLAIAAAAGSAAYALTFFLRRQASAPPLLAGDELVAAVKHSFTLYRNFPSKDFVFTDITPLLISPQLFASVIEAMASHCRELGVDAVVGVESRGFVFGAALAHALGVGFVMARKPGKLPGPVLRRSYDQAYKKGSELEVSASIRPRDGSSLRVVIVDDFLSSGGSIVATHALLTEVGARVVGIVALGTLPLGGAARLQAETGITPFAVFNYAPNFAADPQLHVVDLPVE
eukprot:Amastigsp_a856769_3.p2 type:complete len:263 gc:universal Amastigsp_a856769_3:824-36(-)